ncbi:MAG: aminoglycoside 3-N-acetyltransferase, partial [Abditibacteriota bacterium]|nr:aminoglycoside 3-N-acetyltransferase [Abditibacteriota bacterium]
EVQRRAVAFHDVHVVQRASDDQERPQSQRVPVKAFRGFLAFEDLTCQERRFVAEELGVECSWGAPVWLQEALMFANGKRTVSEIVALLGRHCRHEMDVSQLENIFDFLSRRDQVQWRPFLSQATVKSALQQAGLGRGDAVVGHFALSRFGYIEGGADGLIDALLERIGPDGTLLMPTFSFSWIGRRPYDAVRTPSLVGCVTDRFWRRHGVQRSFHPTHSFAAIGPLASSLLKGHDWTQPPLGPHSPLNRLAEADGKILMFARKNANTSMHVGEHLADIPFVDFLCPIQEDGKHRTVVVPQCPWHVNFDAAYEKMYARGQIRDVRLGESVLHSMRCRDAIAAQAEVAKATPEILLQTGCTCPACQKLALFCEAQGHVPS